MYAKQHPHKDKQRAKGDIPPHTHPATENPWVLERNTPIKQERRWRKLRLEQLPFFSTATFLKTELIGKD